MERLRHRRALRGGIAGLGGAGLGLLLSCVRIGLFGCERDSQCELDGEAGRCLDPGFCALPDLGCPDGYRFHDRGVPDDLAGRCAPLPEPATTESSSSGEASSSSSGSSSSTGSSSDEGSSSTGITDCGDRPCGCTASLGVGTNHSCALRLDGQVVCWGANAQGELGMGTTSSPIPWPQLVPLPGELVPVEILDGNNHSCARAANDAVICWGRNASGEIAPELVRTPVVGPTLLPLDEPPGVVELAPQHTCAASPVGPSLRCLGNNAYGELGGMGTGPIDGAIGGMEAIDQLALGRDHSCARAGARVWCWGRNNYGQLGDPMVTGSTATPTEVSLPGDAIALAGGRDHNCVVLDGGTELVCWGRNQVGQIGDGSEANAPTPTPIAAPLPAPVISMTGRLDTTCALLEDGELWCWGGTYGMELGVAIEAETPLTVPMRVDVIDELPEPVIEAEVGASHLCARAESGRLWCWGRDNNEQLGPVDPPLGKRAVELDLECPPGIGS